jgi:hypothetical protein
MKTVKSILMLCASAMLFTSCAKIPVESVQLSQYLIDEGERMHKINVLFVNSVFAEKREKIDAFITDEYMPVLLKPAMSAIDADDNPKEVIPEVINLVLPKLENRRSSMRNDLESTRIQLITKLDEEYSNFQKSAKMLHALLISGVRVNEERTHLLEEIKTYSNNRLDLTRVEATIDDYIAKGGEGGGLILQVNDLFNR